MIYHFGDCVLDTNLYTLQRGGQEFRLRLKVFRMCLYLLEHRDRVVSREELCTQVWPGQFVSQATLEGVIRLVRQAVGDSWPNAKHHPDAAWSRLSFCRPCRGVYPG